MPTLEGALKKSLKCALLFPSLSDHDSARWKRVSIFLRSPGMQMLQPPVASLLESCAAFWRLSQGNQYLLPNLWLLSSPSGGRERGSHFAPLPFLR